MKGKSWRILKDLVMIFVASLIYGAGISLFLDPNNLAPGGVSGVAVILNRLSGIDTGTLYLLVNIPIILVGIWKFGLRFMGKTMYCSYTDLVGDKYTDTLWTNDDRSSSGSIDRKRTSGTWHRDGF